MSLPTKSDLQTMDWSYKGQPFVRVPANANIDTDTLDWSYRGQPYWCIAGEGGEPPTPPTGSVRIMPSLSAIALGNSVRISAVKKVGL